MKMKGAYIFLCGLLLTAVVIEALLIGIQYYGERTFAECVTRSQLDKLEALETRLIEVHDEHSNWNFLRHNRKRSRDLVTEAGIVLRPPFPPPHVLSGPPEEFSQRPL